MSRVLVTGGTGFIGTPCVSKLVSAGHEVHVAALGGTAEPVAGVTYHDVDLLDPSITRPLTAQVRASHLLHLAWYVAPGAYWTSLENIRWVKAGIDLAVQFADAGGKRAVMVGTCAEYESSAEPLLEGVTPLRPATLYAAAKAGLHLTAQAYMRERNVSFAWAHLFYLFGPREYDARLVPAAMSAFSAGKPFECAHPNDVRDFLYVDDVAHALAMLVDCEVEGDVNVASGEPTTIGDLVRDVATQFPRAELACGPEAAPASTAIVGDSTRLRREVGWKPMWTREAAVAETVEAWSTRKSEDN
ncbi:MAG: NAD(P)-dependent oxidoreductase [Coriobacteriia bacterium]|nr:NAD(P)-dependent oxidoreductase [Coriobacteriia bacterium]